MDEFAQHITSGLVLVVGGVSQWDESTPTRIEYAVELVVPAVNSTTNAVDP